ncbi:hypothetical protein [Actinoplanes sp. GCM10030250]|uniref:hypothetical protein n=1 Tax=Actinoplanes sp. GCM10030250 TaxID=3273376 RepID=UPI00362320DD
MNDTLDELFADLRAQAVREIRPPGATAARRTVRRRRTTTAVASACAVLVVIGGGLALAGQSGTGPALVVPAASTLAPDSAEGLAATALRTLTSKDTNAAGMDVSSPVVAGYERTERMFLPRLKLDAACAGTGTITLVVTGDMLNDKLNRFKDRELTRIPVRCEPKPVPVSWELNAGVLEEITFSLADVGAAAGRAGFAYRVTERNGAPMAPNDPLAGVRTVLGMEDGTPSRAGGSTPETEPGKTFGEESQHAEFPDERYTLALACGGTGTYTLQIRRDGRVLAEHAVECAWPPARRDFRIDGALGKDVSFWSRYEAPPGEIAETGWSLIIR